MLHFAMHPMEDAHGEEKNLTKIASNSFIVILESFCLSRDALNVAVKWNQTRCLDSLQQQKKSSSSELARTPRK